MIKANFKNYIISLFYRMLVLLLPVIKIWEKKWIKKYANQSLKFQPIFIIGAPRTGSTILYQTITNQLDILYIDNLVCKFHENFFFGVWLSNKFFKQKAHNCFSSYHGDTSKCGLHAPSECGRFWYRWLPKDKHFIDDHEITENMVNGIRDEISAVINYFGKPLVFKNLNAGQRLRLLKKCFPNAKFIFIKRNPLFTAQSILKAKRKIGLRDNDFWSIMPKNVEELKKKNMYDQIVKQIFYLEKQIVEDLDLFSRHNTLRLNYNNLGKEFNVTLELCKQFIGAEEKSGYQKAEIVITETLLLQKDEIDKFKKVIEKLDWEEYHDLPR